MRSFPAIPPQPGTILAPAYSPLALAARAPFLRDAAAAWSRAGDAPLTTPADSAWQAYSDDVGQGVRISTRGDRPLHPDDIPGRLRQLRVTTPEGKEVKARAILALDEAASSYDLRNDSVYLMHSLLRDVAGIEAHGLGADAPPRADRTPV